MALPGLQTRRAIVRILTLATLLVPASAAADLECLRAIPNLRFFPEVSGVYRSTAMNSADLICTSCQDRTSQEERLTCMNEALWRGPSSARNQYVGALRDVFVNTGLYLRDGAMRSTPEQRQAEVERLTTACPGIAWATMWRAGSATMDDWPEARNCGIRHFCSTQPDETATRTCITRMNQAALQLVQSAIIQSQVHAAVEAIRDGASRAMEFPDDDVGGTGRVASDESGTAGGGRAEGSGRAARDRDTTRRGEHASGSGRRGRRGGGTGSEAGTGEHATPTPSLLFGVGCDGLPATCATGFDSADLNPETGVTNGCLNREVCAISAELGALGAEAVTMARARWAGMHEELTQRYARLREEMLRRLLRQAGAITAANVRGCDTGLQAFRQEWRTRLSRCEGVNRGAILSSTLASREVQAQERAICEAAYGGSDETRTRADTHLRRQARSLAVHRCVVGFIEDFPETRAADSAPDGRRRASDYIESFFARESGCARYRREVEDRARDFMLTLERPLPLPMGLGSAAETSARDRSLASARERLACIETETNPRLLDDAPGELAEVAHGGRSPAAVMSSETWRHFEQIFSRACARGDDRSAASRYLSGVDESARESVGLGPRDSALGAFGLDELERLVGDAVPIPEENAALTETRARLLTCSAENRTDADGEETLHTLETACGAFAAASAIPVVAAAVATGPVGVGVVAGVNASCALPSAALAELHARDARDLRTYRRAMGNQISCDEAADLMAAEARHGEAMGDALLQSALQAGLSVLEIGSIIRSARSAVAAREALAARVAALEREGGAVTRTAEREAAAVAGAEREGAAAAGAGDGPVRGSGAADLAHADTLPPPPAADLAHADTIPPTSSWTSESREARLTREAGLDAATPEGESLALAMERRARRDFRAVTADSLRAAEREALERLNRLGIRNRTATEIAPISEGAFTRVGYASPHSGACHMIEIMPSSGRTVVPGSTRALEHPELDRLLSEVADLGPPPYRVYVDPSLSRQTQYGAYFDPNTRSVVIPADAPLNSLAHEVRHAVFDHRIASTLGFGNPSTGRAALDSIATGAGAGRPVARRFAPTLDPLIRQAIEMADRGLPARAIDETLAVQAEREALERMGFAPMDYGSLHARRYALSHQRSEIDALGARDPAAIGDRHWDTFIAASREDAFLEALMNQQLQQAAARAEESARAATAAADAARAARAAEEARSARRTVAAIAAAGTVGAPLAGAGGYAMARVYYNSTRREYVVIQPDGTTTSVNETQLRTLLPDAEVREYVESAPDRGGSR